MQTLWQDLRYGARMLVKKPGFSLIAVLALSLGIGVNTTIFSYINAIMFRILAFPEPDRVAFVWSSNRGSGGGQNPVSAPDFLDWREQARSFKSLAAVTAATRTLTGGGEPERVTSAQVSANFFQTLGIQPIAGRAFLPEEEKAGANQVILLGHAFWQRRFAGDPKVIGQTIALDGQSYKVIGITPADFRFVEEGEVWEPLAFDPRADRNLRFLMIFGRLKPGVTVGQADAEMENVTARIAAQFPQTNAGWGSHVMSGRDVLWGPQGKIALTLLMAVVLAVLLIACANVANLQFARAASRQKEIAVRLALGATRFRLVRQLLAENLLLSVLGGALGLLLAVWGLSLVNARYSGALPLLNTAVIDDRVLGYTMLLALLLALIFGLAPALHASRPNLHDALKEGGRGGAGGLRSSRTRNALVVAEISLALMLLVVAGLMIRTIVAYQRVEPGFDPRNLLTMNVSLPARDYPTEQQSREFFDRAIAQIAGTPGVKAVGATSRLPLAGSSRNPRRSILIEGRPGAPIASAADKPWALDLIVSPGYFDAIGITLQMGRALSAQDSSQAQPVAVISRTMANKYWPNEDAVGKRFRFESSSASDGTQGQWISIVGVAGDVRNDDVDEPPLPQVYLPHAQQPTREMSLAVRTAGDPLRFVSAVRKSVWAVDRNLPVFGVATMNQLLFDDLAGIRIVVELLGAFALLALVLAAVGIYGVVSYGVAQRTNEIGVRMALGARGGDVLKLILRQGAKLAAMGVAVGLLGALALTRLMKSILYGVSATDPFVFAGVALLLGLVALVACWLPARRATKVDPMIALRTE